MPRFKITDPSSGKSVFVTGDSAPNEQDAAEIFGRSEAANLEATPPEAPPESRSRISGPNEIGDALAQGRLGNELKGSARQTGEDLLGFIEGVTAGIPRGVIEAMTDLEIPRGSKTGQMIGFVGGPGKLANVAAKGVEKALFKEAVKGAGIKVSEASSSGLVKRGVLEGLKKGARVGATEGFIGGSLFPQEDSLNLKNRFIAGVVGAGLGSPIGAVGGGVSGLLKAKTLAKSASKVDGMLNKIRARGAGKGTSEGAIYDLPGNPSNITKRSVQDPVTKKVTIFDAPAKPRKSFTPGVEPYAKVADKERAAIRNDGVNKNNFLRQQKEAQIADLKMRNEEDLARLQASRNELENMFEQGSDEAIDTVKKIGPKWVRAKYDWYGNSLDSIADDMAKDGVTVKVSNLSDELAGILKGRRIGLEGQAETANTTTAERAIMKWANKLQDYQRPDSRGTPRDAAMKVSDILDEMSRIRELGDSRLNREVTQALTNVLEKSGGGEYAQRIGNLKQEYARFVPMRDLIENSFEPQTENIMGAKRALQAIAKKKIGIVDKTLDRDTLRNLEKIEKEMGVPFLQKLRSYGDDTELLVKQEQELKKLFTEQMASVRSQTADAMRAGRVDTQNALTDQGNKLARTQAVSDAIEARLKQNMGNAFKSLHIPEVVARQMMTAGFAYLLTRALGKMIRKND